MSDYFGNDWFGEDYFAVRYFGPVTAPGPVTPTSGAGGTTWRALRDQIDEEDEDDVAIATSLMLGR